MRDNVNCFSQSWHSTDYYIQAEHQLPKIGCLSMQKMSVLSKMANLSHNPIIACMQKLGGRGWSLYVNAKISMVRLQIIIKTLKKRTSTCSIGSQKKSTKAVF